MGTSVIPYVLNIKITSTSLEEALLLSGCNTMTDLRSRLEIDLRSELDDPNLQIIHVGSGSIDVSCLTVSPRTVLLQCAEKEMRLQILNLTQSIKVAIPMPGRTLEYSEAGEIRHLVGLCFPPNETKSLTAPTTLKPNQAGAPPRGRSVVATEIEFLLEKCKLERYARCETTMDSPDGYTELPALYLNWYESHEKYIGVLVSDLHTQIVSPIVPPGTVLDNDGPHFAQLLTKHLAPYCANPES